MHTYIHNFVDEQVRYWQLAADVYLLLTLLTINELKLKVTDKKFLSLKLKCPAPLIKLKLLI